MWKEGRLELCPVSGTVHRGAVNAVRGGGAGHLHPTSVSSEEKLLLAR
jgi:hypothetical protein